MQIKFFCGGLPAVAALLILLPGGAPAHAADGTTILEPVTVVAAPVDEAQKLPLTGKSTLTAEQIKALPARNGSLNELLTVMPGVQAGEMSNTSLQGAEILPPRLPISGGRFYDNNFMIDGIGNNSLLDPAYSSSMSLFDVPGHPQEVFLESRLVGAIDLYRYNIPARYGNFTGGVVDAQTKEPAAVFGGSLYYRTTRSQWTEFHVADQDEADFENSHDLSMQPDFAKHKAGFELNIPVAANLRLLASYQQSYSRIPLAHLGEEKTQERQGENFFLKGVWEHDAAGQMDLTLIHAPYQAELFKSNTRNGDYRLSGGGTSLASSYRRALAFGDLKLRGGYRSSENSREAPAHHYSWLNTGVNDWGLAADTGTKSFEGGYGTIEKSQDSVELGVDLEVRPLRTGPLVHEFGGGLSYEWFQGSYDRQDTSYIFSTSKLASGVDCSSDPLGCLDSEFFYRRMVYDAHSSNARLGLYSAYLEDQIKWWRLSLRPGLRFSYDDFMHNDNWAPRLATNWDLFGNGKTLLIGGWNRYYGKTLLTYKLREAWSPGRTESRSSTLLESAQPAPWPDPPGSLPPSRYGYSELATPYADEWVLGLDQALLGGRLNVAYVHRKGKDEFARDYGEPDAAGNTPWNLNNSGRSRHEEYSLEWSRNWQRHALTFNATRQETETTHADYDSLFDEATLEELVWYDGEIVRWDELPRQDFNRTWEANLVYAVTFPYGFTFTNVTKYRSGFVGLGTLTNTERTALNIPEEVSRAYQEKKQPESWIFNWKLDWRRNLYRSQGIRLSLEVNNVFNQKVPAGAAEEIQTYELGRQFWAGMEYYF